MLVPCRRRCTAWCRCRRANRNGFAHTLRICWRSWSATPILICAMSRIRCRSDAKRSTAASHSKRPQSKNCARDCARSSRPTHPDPRPATSMSLRNTPHWTRRISRDCCRIGSRAVNGGRSPPPGRAARTSIGPGLMLGAARRAGSRCPRIHSRRPDTAGACRRRSQLRSRRPWRRCIRCCITTRPASPNTVTQRSSGATNSSSPTTRCAARGSCPAWHIWRWHAPQWRKRCARLTRRSH